MPQPDRTVSTDDTVRCWLVDREYDDRDLVTLTYATPDGTQKRVYQRASTLLRDNPATAAITVDPTDLTPVTDPDTRDRYASEATRIESEYQPDDTI